MRLHPEHGAAETSRCFRDVRAGRTQLGCHAFEAILGARERPGQAEPLGPGVLQFGTDALEPLPCAAESCSRLFEPTGRSGHRTARLVEVVVDLVDLVLDLLLLVAEVLLVVVGEGLRSRPDCRSRARPQGQRRRGRSAQVQPILSGEVNSSTVTGRDQTLMYLRVSRSVGISVSAAPMITMPGGNTPINDSHVLVPVDPRHELDPSPRARPDRPLHERGERPGGKPDTDRSGHHCLEEERECDVERRCADQPHDRRSPAVAPSPRA